MVLVANLKTNFERIQPMKKSSTVKSIHVNEEKSKKTPVVDFDSKKP